MIFNSYEVFLKRTKYSSVPKIQLFFYHPDYLPVISIIDIYEVHPWN